METANANYAKILVIKEKYVLTYARKQIKLDKERRYERVQNE
jgi:hypothetical protein